MSKEKKTDVEKLDLIELGKQKGRSPKAVEIVTPEGGVAKETALAKTYLRPTVLAAAMIKGQYPKDDQVNINALVDELSAQVALIKKGDMGRAEAMLISQAHTLDALFAELITRARLNMGQHTDAVNKYMNLALRAQSQCRATLEGLAEIKNPRPYIQNNRAQYQQVNNDAQPQSRTYAQAGENSKLTNGLLEDNADETEWLDTRAPETAGENDKDLETLGTKHRAKD